VEGLRAVVEGVAAMALIFGPLLWADRR